MARILYIYAQINRMNGAHARETRKTLARLRDLGHQIDLLTLPGGDPWPEGLASAVYSTATVPFVRGMPLYGYGLRRILATLFLIPAAVRLMLHHRYAAVHCADRSIRVGRFLSWLFGTRLIFEWRHESGCDLIAWLLLRRAGFHHALALILTDSRPDPARLRATGLSGRVATFLPTPAENLIRAPLPTLSGTGTVRLTAVSASRSLNDLKRFFTILPTLTERLPGLRVSVIGGSPRAIERLRRALSHRAPHAAKIVDFHGRVGGADYAQRMSYSDLIFLPSAPGDCPTYALLDAMGSQRPVVAIRCPAYEGLLTRDCGTLVPPDPAAMTEVLLGYLTDSERMAERGRNAAEKVDHEYDPESQEEAFRACYAFALEEA